MCIKIFFKFQGSIFDNLDRFCVFELNIINFSLLYWPLTSLSNSTCKLFFIFFSIKLFVRHLTNFPLDMTHYAGRCHVSFLALAIVLAFMASKSLILLKVSNHLVCFDIGWILLLYQFIFFVFGCFNSLLSIFENSFNLCLSILGCNYRILLTWGILFKFVIFTLLTILLSLRRTCSLESKNWCLVAFLILAELLPLSSLNLNSVLK